MPIVIIIEHGGTTSACAENTPCLTIPSCRSRNYLRVRGEYTSSKASFSAFVELPPRARRILNGGNDHDIVVGTTSACAENTSLCVSSLRSRGNYLRVRGEYVMVGIVFTRISELPPRARRIHGVQQAPVVVLGTTSACAENTGQKDTERKTIMELPPRARRILVCVKFLVCDLGTTSACAENTSRDAAIR